LGWLVAVLDQGKTELLNIEGDCFVVVLDDDRDEAEVLGHRRCAR
jgi:hypothetical protein